MKRILFLILVGFVWLFVPFTLATAGFQGSASTMTGEGSSVLEAALSQVILLGLASIIPAGLLALSGYSRIGLRDVGIVMIPLFVITVFKFFLSDLQMGLSSRLMALSLITRTVEIVVPFLAIVTWVYVLEYAFRILSGRHSVSG